MNIPLSRRAKPVENLLRVYAWSPDGFLLAGVLELDEVGDRQMVASFKYADTYLEDPRAYPLDPQNMPLSSTPMDTSAPHVVLGAIFDAAPDAWGRRVVRASIDPEQQHRVYRNAFLRGADGIGAVLLTPDEPRDIDAIVRWSLSERPSLSEIAAAAGAARELESGAELDEEAKHLLAGSWTIGGARPKAILRDDRAGAAPDASVIAKFESRDAQADGRNRMEWATLRMARDMGMPVPQHELVDLGDHVALVLERFDRVPSASGMRRRHYVSAASFISAVPQSRYLDSPFDQAMFSWRRLMDVASAVGASASRSRIDVFGRLMLNAAVGNSDDHLKNFGFIKVDDDPMHYELAPVFDCSPQAARQHYLWCGSLGREYTMEQALDMARELKVAAKAAQEVRDRILSVLERRHDYFEAAGMSERQAHAADVWILRGTPELAETAAPLRPLRERA